MVWAALTGGNSYKEYNLLEWQMSRAFTFLDYKYKYPNFTRRILTTAKTRGEQYSAIGLLPQFLLPQSLLASSETEIFRDHTFAILGYYEISYNNNSMGLIHLFNPWHVDVFVSNNEYNESSSFWRSEEVKRQNLPFTQDAEDGKFFLSLGYFFTKFEKIFQMEVDYTMKAIAFEIPLLDLADNTVNIEELNYEYELYWDILVGNNFDVQIQPYNVTSLVQMENDLRKNPLTKFSENQIIEKNISIWLINSTVYQGLTIHNKNLISLQVMRYNDDIIDAISLFVYTNKSKVISFKNKSKYLTGCKNNCSSHGTCQGNICNCSHGVNFLSFYQII